MENVPPLDVWPLLIPLLSDAVTLNILPSLPIQSMAAPSSHAVLLLNVELETVTLFPEIYITPPASVALHPLALSLSA